jgi:hypothetical protein
MLPTLSSDNISNRYLAYSEYRREFQISHAARSIADANFAHLILGKASPAIALAALTALTTAPFFLFVGHVVGVRAEKQVIWSDARGIIAAVKHMHPIRYQTIGQFPRSAMCPNVDQPSVVMAGHMPVPILIGTAKPQPTSVAVNSLNLAPKSVYDWCRMMFGGLETTVTAKPAGRRWPTSERYAALFARILGLHRRVPPVGVTVGACSNTRPTLRFYKGII